MTVLKPKTLSVNSTTPEARGTVGRPTQEASPLMRKRNTLRPSLSLPIWLIGTTTVLALDTQRPICVSSIIGSGTTAVVDGSASDKGSGQTGIVSVALDSSSINLTCAGCTSTPLSRPASRVSFSLGLADPDAGIGRGTVIVSDAAGNTCRVGATYSPVAQGQVTNQPLLIEPAQGVKLFALAGTSVAAGEAVVASNPPTSDDVDCLPACFEFLPESLVLTVDSPIQGFTTVALDTLGGDDVRLLSRHPTDRCPYPDISDSIRGLVFDPRLKGGTDWSRVQFVAAREIDPCVVPKRVDADRDGFFVGGSTPAAGADCNDANADVNPGAAERCNGLDDDCDGAVDEAGCGTVLISATLHTVGTGGNPDSTVPMVGAEVRLYDAGEGTCASSAGIDPKCYAAIYGAGTFENPGCVAETSGLTNAQGKVSFAAAPAFYIAVVRPPAPQQDARIGITVGTINEGDQVQKQVQLVIDENGDEVPSRNCP